MTITQINPQKTFAFEVADFDLDATLDCGQCFRWERGADGSWGGIAYAQKVNIRFEGEMLLFTGADKNDFERVWRGYFDLDRDYGAIKESLSADWLLKRAILYASGIRVLRQEPWEALCSFIISQNNNIPRIKGIISRLCERFGEPLAGGDFAFPSAHALCGLESEDLAPIRSGFRAGYILDAARRVESGEIDLEALKTLPLSQAREALLKIRGVGPKVSDCALLFGCGRLDCFPVDVWIKRVLASFYPDGFPPEFEPFGGIAQQYLFHYARCCPECELILK